MKTSKCFHAPPFLAAVLTLAALVFAAPPVACAGIIASDTFNSYDGASSLDWQSGASNNWATGWRAGPSASVTAYSTTATLAYTPPGGSPVGGGKTIEVGGTGTGIPAFRQIYNPVTDTFYVGALVKWNGTLNSGDGVTIFLTDNETNTSNGFNFGLLGIWSTYGTSVRKGTGNPVTGAYKSLPTQTGTYYMVLKVEKTGGGNFDKVTGWINPTMDSEATNSNGNIRLIADSGVSSVSHVILRGQGLDSGDSTRIESLALATAYADLMAAPGDGPANPPPVDTLRVETKADGSGVVVPAQTITAGTSLTNFAVARDSGGAYLGNVVATAWYLTNLTGAVVPGDLVRSPDAKSAVFKGAGAGSAQIVAVAEATNLVFSGTITVELAPASQVRVETAPDGSGTVVPATRLTQGQTITAYAIARDAGGNFIDNVAATWSLVNISGNVASSDLVPAGDNKSATFTAGALPGSANLRVTSGALTSVDSGLITVLRQLTWSGLSATWDGSQLNWYLPDFTTLSNFVSGDSVTFDDTGAGNPSVTLAGGLSPESVTVAGFTAYTLGGAGKITGAATLTNTSVAGLTVLTDNDYTGVTAVGGDIQLGNGGDTGSFGSGKIVFTANKTVNYNRTNSLVITNQFTGTGTLAVNSGTVVLPGGAGNNNLKILVASNATVVLAKTNLANAGDTLELRAGGVAKIGANNGQLNTTKESQVDGTVDLQGFNQTFRVVSPCTGVFDSTVFGGGGCTLTLGNSSVAQSFAGEIKDSGWDATHKLSLNKAGTFVLQLGGTNSYHGNTTITLGTLQVMSATAIPHGPDFGNVVFNGGSLDLNGYDITVNGISGGNTLSDSTFLTTTLTLGDGDATASHGGAINGIFGVTKMGAGVQTFTGTKNYSGNTVIAKGTLRINGTLANSPLVTVEAAGTLGGTGTVGGAVVNNGTLAPGATGIGTLTIHGDLTLNAGSTNTFEVNGSAGTNDGVIAGATVTYGGGLNIVPTGIFTNGQTFELFSGPGAANASNFDSLTVSGGGGPTFMFTNGVLTVLSAPALQPTIAPVTVSGTNLVVAVPTVPGAQYVLQSATNLTPAIHWQNESTNAGTGGDLILNVPIETGKPQKFLRFWVY